jgi:hypothetical protein
MSYLNTKANARNVTAVARITISFHFIFKRFITTSYLILRYQFYCNISSSPMLKTGVGGGYPYEGGVFYMEGRMGFAGLRDDPPLLNAMAGTAEMKY